MSKFIAAHLKSEMGSTMGEVSGMHRIFGRFSCANVAAGLVLSLGLVSGGAANAQSVGGGLELDGFGVRSFAGLAVGAIPDYEGSDDYTVGVAPLGVWRYGKSSERYLKIIATELSWNAIDSKTWSAGPALNYRLGRDDVDDTFVDKMAEIDDAVELGAFVGYTVTGSDPRDKITFSLQALGDVSDTHDGFTATASVKRFWPISRSVTLSFGAITNYANDDYTDTYFGVSAADSSASGLRQYTADGGFRDVRIPIFAIFSFSPKWHVAAGMVYTRLLGDAADSPVVDDRGSADQFFVGASVIYAW
jgi:outer membrane protein